MDIDEAVMSEQGYPAGCGRCKALETEAGRAAFALTIGWPLPEELIAARMRYQALREALKAIIRDGHEMVTDEIDGMPIDRCLPGCAACVALAALAEADK